MTKKEKEKTDDVGDEKEITKTKPVRTSTISKTIRRTVSTAAYETIVIEEHIEENIDWTTVGERQEKVRNWTKVLIETFKETHDEVMEELGLEEKKAYFPNKPKQTKYNEPDTTLEDLEEFDDFDE